MGQVYGAHTLREITIGEYVNYHSELEGVSCTEDVVSQKRPNGQRISEMEMNIYLSEMKSVVIFSGDLLITRIDVGKHSQNIITETEHLHVDSDESFRYIDGVPDLSTSCTIYSNRGRERNYKIDQITLDFTNFYESLSSVLSKRAFLKEYRRCIGYDEVFTYPENYNPVTYSLMYEDEVEWMYQHTIKYIKESIFH